MSEPESHISMKDCIPGFSAVSLGAPGTVADDVQSVVQQAVEGVHTEVGVYRRLQNLHMR